MRKFCFKCWDWVFSYDENRVIRIRSFSLGIIRWLAFFGVLLFVVVFFILHKRGYQEFDDVESAVTTKLFGVAKASNDTFRKVWDNADYMVPPKENGAFTVITSVLVTQNQVEKICDEDPNIRGAQCQTDADCPAEKARLYGNGVMTGNCINSTRIFGIKVCEISAWCPVEIDDPAKRVQLATENFTVFIRNDVRFPLFKKNRFNIPNDMDAKELDTCVYDPKHPRNKHCPIFTIRTITEQAGHSFRSMMTEGGVIQIIIYWDCNFDFHDECLPTYSFHRLDRQDSAPRRGFHLRYSDHHAFTGGPRTRDLYRAYGIRVLVTVQGHGRKFDPGTTVFTVGSAISYFSVGTILISGLILGLYGCCRRCCGKCCRTCCGLNGRCGCCGRCCCGCCGSCCCGCCVSDSTCICLFKPFTESSRCDGDRRADDLQTIQIVFHDSIKTCNRGCCLCGDREYDTPEAATATSDGKDTPAEPTSGVSVPPASGPASADNNAMTRSNASSQDNRGFICLPENDNRPEQSSVEMSVI